MTTEQNKNKNQNQNVVKGANEHDVKIAEIKSAEKQTNEHDVKVAEVSINIERLKQEVEMKKLENQKELAAEQAEREERTKRINKFVDAAQATIVTSALLTGFIYATNRNFELNKFKVEFGRD